MKMFPILQLVLLFHCVLQQEIVDYSHTASIQKSELDSTKKYEITISPSQLNSELLDFPSACSRSRELLTNEII